MSEAEYILVADLRTIRQTITALREVIPENNPNVPRDEYQAVMGYLSEWQDRMFAALPILTEQP